jgi:hypothetical protein
VYRCAIEETELSLVLQAIRERYLTKLKSKIIYRFKAGEAFFSPRSYQTIQQKILCGGDAFFRKIAWALEHEMLTSV